MNVRVRLVHADGQQRIVVVQAFEGERFLGAALGEAASAEEAEDRARERLQQRLQSSRSEPALVVRPSHSVPNASAPLAQVGVPAANAPEVASAFADSGAHQVSEAKEPEVAADPVDWSADLAELDRLLRKLGWGREEESSYVQRLFGQPNRSRLTRYEDLMVLRRALQALPPGSQPGSAPLPLLRSDLLAHCDGLLVRLGWTTERARQALEQHFAVTTRQHLTDEQLLAFNVLLEGELLSPAASGEDPTLA